MEEINLHDYYIDKLELDFNNGEATLWCTFEDKKTKSGMRFTGFLAAKLDDILPGSIILDFEEWDIPSFIKIEEKYLLQRQRYGWPISSKNLKELEDKLVSDSYKVWWLSPTYGMGGYIIAKSVMEFS